ncbi:hypothetical protein [Corynebacterium hindlerae]|uniref:hypothetical protein n=1 Tax=Corynebacterium hindlerae TaxID=699041 RepID=UPI0031B677CC
MSVITPPRTPNRAQSTALLDRPSRPLTQPAPRKFQRKLGSQQVVSVRGRRVAVEKANPHRVNMGIAVIVFMFLTVAAAMVLSGKSTEQSFQLQKLVAQEQQLDNQLETLNRDVEQAKAAAEVARVAADNRMVVAEQPGILAVEKDGSVSEQRPSNPEAVRPIIDVNGAQIRPEQASSNPNETKAVTDTIEAIPQNSSVPAVAPYAPRARGAQN